MKKIITTMAIILLAMGQSTAHYLWIETKPKGAIGEEQEVRIYFGEYTYGVIEKVEGEAYAKVKDFSLWVEDAIGKKNKLAIIAKDDYYVATFKPEEKGTYTIVLDNDNIEVIDYSKYDFGIFKTHYHATATVVVGTSGVATAVGNNTGLVISQHPTLNEEVRLQILYKNQPYKEGEVKVFIADQWSKILTSDKDGFVLFDLPWDTKYIVEVTRKEEVPGEFRGEKYEFIWHASTYTILREKNL